MKNVLNYGKISSFDSIYSRNGESHKIAMIVVVLRVITTEFLSINLPYLLPIISRENESTKKNNYKRHFSLYSLSGGATSKAVLRASFLNFFGFSAMGTALFLPKRASTVAVFILSDIFLKSKVKKDFRHVYSRLRTKSQSQMLGSG